MVAKSGGKAEALVGRYDPIRRAAGERFGGRWAWLVGLGGVLV